MQKKTEDASSNKNRISENSTQAGYLTLIWEFFKIGTFTIGGGAAMIPQMQQTVTEEKGWLTEEEMLDCIAMGQSLPGVIAVNTATYIGYRQRGISGALAATLGVILPAFIAMLIALLVLDFLGDNRYVAGAFMGVKAAVCGLIIVTAVKLMKQMLKGAGKAKVIFTVIMALGSLAAVGFFGVTAILVILIGIAAGIAFNMITFMASKEGK